MANVNPYQSPPSVDKRFPKSFSDDSSFTSASRWLRLAGAIPDCGIVGIPLWGILYCTGLYDLLAHQRMPILYLGLCGMTVFLLVNVVLIYRRGQTLGKLICGIVVVTKDDRIVSGNRYLFLRQVPIWLICQIPYLGPIFGLLDVVAIFRSEKKCIHDEIAGTKVVMRFNRKGK